MLAISRKIIPPTANFLGLDPACDLDVVPNTARPAEIEWALSNSFAFGGLNAVLAFRRVSSQIMWHISRRAASTFVSTSPTRTAKLVFVIEE